MAAVALGGGFSDVVSSWLSLMEMRRLGSGSQVFGWSLSLLGLRVLTWLNPFSSKHVSLVSLDIRHQFLASPFISEVRSRRRLGNVSELNRGGEISLGGLRTSVGDVFGLASSKLVARGGFFSCLVRRSSCAAGYVLVLQVSSIFTCVLGVVVENPHG